VQPKKNLDLVNVLFLVGSPFVAVSGVYLLFHLNGPAWQSWILFAVMMVVTGLSVTGGYHRLFSHRSFKANPFVRLFFLLFGAAAFENSALKWSADHRLHHRYVDTDQDPYNIKKGFFWAHMGWIFYRTEKNLSVVTDLSSDPLVRFQDHYYLPLSIAFGFLLPTAIAALWGDALGGLILAGWVRIVLNHHFTFFINSLAHTLGSQPYSDRNSSRDSFICALVSYGEGYHNFHHSFQSDYRNGVRFWQFDPTKWVITFLSWIGLVWDLRVTPRAKLMKARFEMQEKRFLSKLSQSKWEMPKWKLVEERVQKFRSELEEAYLKFEKARSDYHAFKKKGSYHLKLEEIKSEYRASKEEFKLALLQWKRALSQELVLVV